MTPDDRALIMSLAQEVGRLAGEASGTKAALEDARGEFRAGLDGIRTEVKAIRTDGINSTRWRVTAAISISSLVAALYALFG